MKSEKTPFEKDTKQSDSLLCAQRMYLGICNGTLRLAVNTLTKFADDMFYYFLRKTKENHQWLIEGLNKGSLKVCPKINMKKEKIVFNDLLQGNKS